MRTVKEQAAAARAAGLKRFYRRIARVGMAISSAAPTAKQPRWLELSAAQAYYPISRERG
jgi:hypothetical protein